MRIVVIDDEQLIQWFLKEGLAERGYDVAIAKSGEEGLDLIERDLPDLVILDLKLPGLSGLQVLERLKRDHPDVVVVMITAHGDVNSAVQAMKLGAHDFIPKPFKMEEMALVLNKALATARLRAEVTALRRARRPSCCPSELVGTSPAIMDVMALVEKVAPTDAIVLIQGESGTGKDLTARIIHDRSPRSTEMFLEVDCTSLPSTLFESEIFGHEKGAFTDAKTAKKGLIETAERGTVLLNEIADVPLPVQAKLLRLIEQKAFRRLGGTRDIQVDARLIACTNRDLQKEVAKGGFREDLYYRLKVFPLTLPPLRERAKDIPELVRCFVADAASSMRKPLPPIGAEAMDLLGVYPWPGNVRELKNVIERAMILAEGGPILPLHLPTEIVETQAVLPNHKPPVTLPDQGASLGEIEKELIAQALAKTGGNQSQAARLLGISRDTLRYRMEKHGLA
ncbi:MAG: sigma-54-dependent Fis family transcriptional regulator [Nitrospirae bacterium]|nr:sigma-54-dependent Fis family transcriptional regulator [Nitrospirota bacterium]